MARERYPYGVLNPVVHPQEGRLLDPESTTGVGTLKKVATDANTPNFMDRVTGPMKGVVLYVYEKKAISSEEDLITKDEKKPKLARCRVRIPEIHAHLPDPAVYGPEAENQAMSAISLHPIFVAQSEDIDSPDVGEIVWVDFKDRKRQQDPIYVGRLSNSILKAGVAAVSKEVGSLKDKFVSGVQNFLGITPASGDSLAQNDGKSESGQTPGSQNLEKKKQEASIPKSNPGLYDTYESGVKTGQNEMIVWVNADGSQVLVRSDVEHTLQLMKEDMQRDLNIEVRLNSGFRTYEEQEYLYNSYKEKKKKWEESGSDPNSAPSPAARPGYSKHNNGRATDFQTGVTRSQTRGKSKEQLIEQALTGQGFTKVWSWLIANSQNYGWVWTGGDFSPKEPWHFEFNESLARTNGLYPESKNG